MGCQAGDGATVDSIQMEKPLEEGLRDPHICV